VSFTKKSIAQLKPDCIDANSVEIFDRNHHKQDLRSGMEIDRIFWCLAGVRLTNTKIFDYSLANWVSPNKYMTNQSNRIKINPL
jgi:hypothetical protein